jgi:hypothetical protein
VIYVWAAGNALQRRSKNVESAVIGRIRRIRALSRAVSSGTSLGRRHRRPNDPRNREPRPLLPLLVALASSALPLLVLAVKERQLRSPVTMPGFVVSAAIQNEISMW